MNKNLSKDLIEMAISSQAFSKNNWKLIKKYKNKKNNYYALIECEICKNQEIVNYYNFVNTTKTTFKCNECKFHNSTINEIGKIYGSVEILELDHMGDADNYGTIPIYFKTKCTNCGKISVRHFNKTQWSLQKGCKSCNSVFDNPSLNSLLQSYKNSANVRNINWELLNEEFLEIIYKDCYYCGEPPRIRKHDQSVYKEKVSGIDRLNSSQSYVLENCVPCCTMCNYMKQSYTEDTFLNQINRIYNYNLKKEGSTTSRKTYTQVSGNGEHPRMVDDDIV